MSERETFEEIKSYFERVSTEVGWDTHSDLHVLMSFIHEHGDHEAFKKFVRNAADFDLEHNP